MANGERQVLSLEVWKDRVKAGDTPQDVMLYKDYACDEIKVVGEPKDRKLGFVISTERRDRYRDTIALDGWELAEFRRNPVVLWAHSHRDLPVARAPEVSVDENALRSVAQFPTAEVHKFGDTVFQLLLGKFLNASSVGFDPSKFIINDDERGIDFVKQELLEWSIVPVPANPDALQGASAAGIDLQPMVAWAEQTLDEWQDEGGVLVLPRSHIEQAYRISSGRLAFVVPGDVRELPADLELVDAFDDNLAPPKAAGEGDSAIVVYNKAGEPVGSITAAVGSTGAKFELINLAVPAPSKVYATLEEVAGDVARGHTAAADDEAARAEWTEAYKQFHAVPPWERDAEAWAAYEAWAVLARRRSYASTPDADVALANMLLELGFALEAGVLVPPATPEAEFADALEAEYGFDLGDQVPGLEDDVGALLDGASDADLAELATALAEPIRDAARSAMTQFTGRLD